MRPGRGARGRGTAAALAAARVGRTDAPVAQHSMKTDALGTGASLRHVESEGDREDVNGLAGQRREIEVKKAASAEILIGHASEEMLAESVGDCRSVGLVQGAMAIGFQRNQIPGRGYGENRGDKAKYWGLVLQWIHSRKVRGR